MLPSMLVYHDGQIVPATEARVSVFDRGFLFGDGIYEGLRAFDGWVRNLDDHVARMQQGLDEAGICWDASALHDLCPRLLDANNARDAFMYWQITRGTPKPGQPVRARLAEPDITPTIFGYCQPLPAVEGLREPTSCSAVTLPDTRWHKGHVKAVSLIANVMTARDAANAGGDEAIMLRDGRVSESCATNIFVAVPDGTGGHRLLTPPLDDVSILPGVTRQIILGLCPEIKVRPISAEELAGASEVFLTGTITTVKSVVQLDGKPVGTGTPGPIARDVLDRYTAFIAVQLAARAVVG
jgi:D-alanine transaminase